MLVCLRPRRQKRGWVHEVPMERQAEFDLQILARTELFRGADSRTLIEARDTAFKKLQSRIANAVRGRILRDGTRDSGCGLKLVRRDVLLGLPYFDGLHRFLPALVTRDGFLVRHVDVIDRPRRAGQSNYGMWDRLWVGILDLAGVWWLIRRRRRVPEISEVGVDAD